MNITKKINSNISGLLIGLIFSSISCANALMPLSDELLGQIVGQSEISPQVLNAFMPLNTELNATTKIPLSNSVISSTHSSATTTVTPSTVMSAMDAILNNLPLQFSVVMSQIYNTSIEKIPSNNGSQIAIQSNYVIPYLVLSHIHINAPLQTTPASTFFGSLGFVNIHIKGTIYY